MGTLLLIPWHIGDRRDVTVGALQELRRLRCIFAEAPGSTRRELAGPYGIDCADKTILEIPFDPDPRLVQTCLERLQHEDVGLVASGGTPCFVDPGAWLVRDLRARGATIRALAGASILAPVLSLSGIEWSVGLATFTFHFFRPSRPDDFVRVIERTEEPLIVVLAIADLGACLDAVPRSQGGRSVTVYFDLAKRAETSGWSNRVETRRCREWRESVGAIPWATISEIAILFHPAG